MNSQSENRSQRNSALDALMKKNTETMAAMELTPYEPMVYAIPIEQRNAEMELLKSAVTFQPTLYQMIQTLATRQELSKYVKEIQDIETDYMNKTVKAVTAENEMTTQQLRETIEQAGRTQEEFISKVSSMLDGKTKALDEVLTNMRRRILQIVIGTSAAAVMLSVLVSLLFWRLPA